MHPGRAHAGARRKLNVSVRAADARPRPALRAPLVAGTTARPNTASSRVSGDPRRPDRGRIHHAHEGRAAQSLRDRPSRRASPSRPAGALDRAAPGRTGERRGAGGPPPRGGGGGGRGAGGGAEPAGGRRRGRLERGGGAPPGPPAEPSGPCDRRAGTPRRASSAAYSAVTLTAFGPLSPASAS